MDRNMPRIEQLRTLVSMLVSQETGIDVDGIMVGPLNDAEWEFVVREHWGCVSITGLTNRQLCEWYLMAEVTGLEFIMNDIVDYFVMFGAALSKDLPVGLLVKLVKRLSQRIQLLRAISVDSIPIGVLQSQDRDQLVVRMCMTSRYKKCRRNL